jgi:EmrB/QacA subfamily drug resistance transporter
VSTPTTAVTAPRSFELGHRQILQIMAGLMLGMFLAALDQTIVASAMRTIGDDLHGLSVQAWVTTAYLITATITTPLYGKLSDIYGRKPVFLTAISIFVVGSALCSLATSMYMLAAFRALQGLGAGGLFTLALAIIADIVPPRERARYQGYFLAVFGTSSVIGPIVGGFFAGQASILGITGWRWVFLVNVPIAIAALIVVAKVLNVPHTRHNHRIDWQGAVALTVGLIPLLIVAEQGRGWGWTSPGAIACYLVGVVGLLGFVWAESRAGDEALIPLRLFRNRTFSMTSVVGLIVGMGMFGVIVSLPLYLQIAKGLSPTAAGLMTVPLVVGIMAGSIVGGQLISRTGRYKVYPVIGSALMVLGAILFTRITADTELWVTALYMPVFGLGLGMVMQPVVLAVQNAVPPQDIGVATASSTFFRQIGGTLGTAVFLSVLFSTVTGKITDAFGRAAQTPQFQDALKDPAVLSNPANRAVLDAMKSGSASAGSGAASALNDSSFIQKLSDVLAYPFKVGFSDAMHVVFWMGAGVLAIAFVILLFLPEVPLRTQSGMAARREQEQAQADAEAEGADVSAAAGLA